MYHCFIDVFCWSDFRMTEFNELKLIFVFTKFSVYEFRMWLSYNWNLNSNTSKTRSCHKSRFLSSILQHFPKPNHREDIGWMFRKLEQPFFELVRIYVQTFDSQIEFWFQCSKFQDIQPLNNAFHIQAAIPKSSFQFHIRNTTE